MVSYLCAFNLLVFHALQMCRAKIRRGSELQVLLMLWLVQGVLRDFDADRDGQVAKEEFIQKAELILKCLGGWAGPLPTIFRRPPTKIWLESPSKTKENPGKAKKAKGRPRLPTKKWLGGPLSNHS